MKALPEKLEIRVLPTNIRRGVPMSYDSCPIALAVKRELRLRGDDYAEVGCGEICIMSGSSPEPVATYQLPKEANDFVGDFDDQDMPRCEFKPFTFVAEMEPDR